MESFSKRQGYRQKEKEITIREDAPTGLREFIPEMVYDLDYEPSNLRTIVCGVLKVRPDKITGQNAPILLPRWSN
jgi:hypothetical protein